MSLSEDELKIQPWWLDDQDQDLHRTDYEESPSCKTTAISGEDEEGSTSSSLYIEDMVATNTKSMSSKNLSYTSSKFAHPQSVRRGRNAQEPQKTIAPPTSNVATFRTNKCTTDYKNVGAEAGEIATDACPRAKTTSSPNTSSSLSPTRQKLRAWKDHGKSITQHAIDRMKLTAQKLNNNSTTKSTASTTVRWNCEACTYLNVKRPGVESLLDSFWTCEICGTPTEQRKIRNIDETNTLREPIDTNNKDDIISDRVPTLERADDGLDSQVSAAHTDRFDLPNADSRSSSGIFGTKRDSGGKSRALGAMQDTFHRLFFPLRQSSTTTNDTGSVSADMERPENVFDNRSRHSDTAPSSLGSGRPQHYSVSELVASLGAVNGDDVDLPPALERRVRDFKFAQTKRRERHGDQKPWGIYGLYAHLSDIRADLEWAEDAAWRRQRGQPYLSWRDFDKSRDKGLHNRPLFTYCVLGLCTIMMIVTFGVNGWKFEPLNVNPLIGPSSETLIKCGARDTNLIVNEGQWFRLFTPMILHAGLIHYFVNMMALYFIGGAVEQSHGFASAAVLFIIPAVGGNILSAICLPQYISVGASGGIFGLIGGCIADISLNWNLLFLKTTTDVNTRVRHFYVLLWLGVDIVINCLLGFTPFVDNFTHLGGFMYGFCCGISTIERLALGFFGISSDKCSRLGNIVMRFFGLIVSIIAIMVTTVVLVQSDGVTSPCHGCRYISCVPFPPKSQEKWWYCDDCDVVIADLFESADGSGLYEQVNVHCPNGVVEEIFISEDGIDDKEELRRALPAYCRAHCEEVFASN